MKSLFNKYTLTVALTAVVGSVMAQDLNSAYFTDGYSYRHDMNPAYDNEYNYIAIPVLGNLGMQLRGSLGVGDLFFSNPDYGKKPGAKKTASFLHPSISADEALSGLDKGGNNMLLNVDIPIFSMGFGGFKGYNTIELRERSFVGASIPYDFFEFAKEMKNKDYTFDDLGMRAWSYMELGFGHSRRIYDNLRVGAKVKLLFGIGYADVSMSNVHASLEGDHWVLDGKARAEVNMKGAKFKEKVEEYKSTPGKYYKRVDGLDVDGTGLNGFGLGLDLGAVYEFKDCSISGLNGLKASLALTDLGFINYGNKIVAESSGKTFEFDGFNNVAVKEESGATIEDKTDEVSDKLADFANLETKPEESGGSSSHGLGATLRFGLEYPIPSYNKLKFGFLYTHRYSDLYAWSEGRLSANYAPAKWLDGGINLGFSSFSTEMGWIINVHPKGLNFFVGMDYMIGKTGKSMIPLDSNVGFNVGINITFNGKKDKRKLETL
jgi:hypothetical protein